MNQAIQLKVNDRKLFQNLRHAFSAASVLGELMQNARRAGATRVEILFEGITLSVLDDGKGIDNLQDLLTAADSGWDQETTAQESPFGLGFLSTLYCSKQIEVYTRKAGDDIGTGFIATTEELLNGGKAYPVIKEMPVGTQVTLKDFTLPGDGEGRRVDSNQVLNIVKQYASGFPIAVGFNGVAMACPNAIDSSYVETAIGHVKLDLNCRRFHQVFLQGLPIYRCGLRVDDAATIVHLNNTFMAKLPDRTELTDQNVGARRIEAALKALAREMLESLKSSMTPEVFLFDHAKHCKDWGCTELLNDIDLVPGEWFMDWTNEQPGHRREWESPETLSGYFRRKELEREGVFAMPDEEDMLARSWLAAKRAYTVLRRQQNMMLNDEHWLQKIMVEMSDDEIEVQITGETLTQDISAGTEASLVIADTVSLLHEAGKVPLPVDAAYDAQNGTLYMSRKADPGAHSRLVSDFYWDDQYHEGEEDEFNDEVRRAFNELTSESALQLMKLKLAELKCSRETRLANTRFTVVFDEKGALQDILEA